MMKIAFVDESGSPSPNDRRRFFVVAALVVDSERPFELAIKQARRLLRLRSPLSELKASTSQPKVIKPLLMKLAQIPFRSIISIFWGRKFPKFESRAFSCSTQTSEISPGFLKGYWP
jgi:hypothetical protein